MQLFPVFNMGYMDLMSKMDNIVLLGGMITPYDPRMILTVN